MDESTFVDALDDNPHNWSLRLVYSDWLEQEGRLDEADAQRWMAAHRKSPKKTLRHQWEWWVVPIENLRLFQGLGDQEVLPMGEFSVHDVPGEECIYGFYNSRKNAERELMDALIDKGLICRKSSWDQKTATSPSQTVTSM